MKDPPRTHTGVPGQESNDMDPAWISIVSRELESVDISNPSRPGDRRAGVLLGILDGESPAVLGIIRTDRGPHGGQFSLPGGMLEEGEDSLGAAIRESREETGLDAPAGILGDLGEFNTHGTRFRVNVHVAHIHPPKQWVPQDDEVEAIVAVPLEELMEIQDRLPVVDDVWNLPIEAGFEFPVEPHLLAGRIPSRGEGHRIQTATGWRDMPLVWGLTARVFHVFLDKVWRQVNG